MASQSIGSSATEPSVRTVGVEPPLWLPASLPEKLNTACSPSHAQRPRPATVSGVGRPLEHTQKQMTIKASQGWIQLEQGQYREDRQMDKLQEEHRVRQKVATHCLTNEVLVGLYKAFLFF